jgi:hypothetical protein
MCYTSNIHFCCELWSLWHTYFFSTWNHLPCTLQPSSFLDKLQGPHSFAKWGYKPKDVSHKRKLPSVHTHFSWEWGLIGMQRFGHTSPSLQIH